MAPRAISSWGKLRVKAQATVAKVQRRAMTPTVFFRLQRSTMIETGKTKATMDQ
jgi:hypothetical protein